MGTKRNSAQRTRQTSTAKPRSSTPAPRTSIDGAATAIKRGRPRKFETVSWFGMKVSPEDRQKIHLLAQLEGKTATKLILDLVEQQFRKRAGRVTYRELMKLAPKEREKILETQAQRAIEFDHYHKAA